ncbi:MAG: hypothetical protein IPL50_06985 [Chitinophagaceae bacterium]|nr:hypothetical protein [Chitinophagaceae bacterium]
MKKSIPALIAVCSLLMLINSCSTGKNTVDQNKTETSFSNPVPSGCFVEWNDGTIQHYSSLKLVTGILITPHLVADNKVIINSGDILAYQDKGQYAVSYKRLKSAKKALVAAEALPGFAVKLVSGKLNVYSRKYYNGGNTVNEYFLQHGEEGSIVAYSKEVMKSMLKEDKKALDYFISNSKLSPESKKILATVEMYNNSQFITRN